MHRKSSDGYVKVYCTKTTSLQTQRKSHHAAHPITLRIGCESAETSLLMQIKHTGPGADSAVPGNISVCAEKTEVVRPSTDTLRKHLCMRRENNLFAEIAVTAPETSLHTQRKPKKSIPSPRSNGNISAHAEKTSGCKNGKRDCRKHLCTCRENMYASSAAG